MLPHQLLDFLKLGELRCSHRFGHLPHLFGRLGITGLTRRGHKHAWPKLSDIAETNPDRIE
ncbi:MAG TPA: hypothetical protein VED17_02575, partial [Nitrososphaerales archaeon]|nr:hypothetical protein [Nitrososphaerales archaeon]